MREGTGKETEKLYDLAVVGAGPAGALAAWLAAKKGLSVLLLEKKRLPRDKICGGFVSARALKLLPGALRKVITEATPVKTVIHVKGKAQHVFRTEETLGLLVKRKTFDTFLAEEAVKMGATLQEKSPLRTLEILKGSKNSPCYQLKTGSNTFDIFKARYVIAADGAYGKTACCAGLRKNRPFFAGLASASTRASSGKAAGTLSFFPLPLIGGMGWSFSGEGWCNQGVGGLARPEKLHRYYKNLFGPADESSHLLTWALPFTGPLLKAGAHQVLAIGDAAALVEPFSGEGLFNAFLSARLAVESVLEAEAKQALAGEIYQRYFKQYFRKNYPLVLARAFWLHGQAILAPASFPAALATLMKNNYTLNL